MIRKDVEPYLTKKDKLIHWILFSLGIIIFFVPYQIPMLILFIILSPLIFVLGEVPDWLLNIRDIPLSTYFYWLSEYNRKKAVKYKELEKHNAS